MKKGWTGFESAGKSQLMVVEARDIYYRNVRWMKKRAELKLPTIPRTMAFDTPVSQDFINAIERAGMKYLYFEELSDLFPITEMDIFIHEAYAWFPSRGNEPLTHDQRVFLSQGAKEGVDIYFCTQDFSLVHKGFRFLVNEMDYVVKIVGSDRPRKSAPPVNKIWGLVLHWEMDPRTFKGDDTTMEFMSPFPQWYFINRDDTQLYDTSFKVKGIGLPPVRYVEQEHIYFSSEGEELKREVKFAKR